MPHHTFNLFTFLTILLCPIPPAPIISSTAALAEESDKDGIERDSLESIESIPGAQDESAPGEDKPQDQEQQGESLQEPQGEQQEVPLDDSKVEDNPEEASDVQDELEAPDGADSYEGSAPEGETEADETQEETHDETQDEMDGPRAVGVPHGFEEPFSPAYSESKTFDIITDTDRGFDSEGKRPAS